jgi:dUTP pyrophosphatase
MEKLKIKIYKDNRTKSPEYQTDQSSGADLFASHSGEVKKGEFKLVKTGLKLSIPEGFEAQIRPRSGLALKYGVTVLNTPGTIDSDYRGEIGVIIVNFGDNTFVFNEGDRLAQLVFSKVYRAEFENVEFLDSTERQEGGFGHTGT